VELIKRLKGLKEPAVSLAWKVAEAVVGGAIGLLMVTLYLRYR